MTFKGLPREVVLKRRREREGARRPIPTGSYRGCGWNHRVPGAEVLDGLCEPRTRNPRDHMAPPKRMKPKKWKKLKHWISAVECNSEPGPVAPPKRQKHIERGWRGQHRDRMSYNDLVQHGHIRED